MENPALPQVYIINNYLKRVTGNVWLLNRDCSKNIFRNRNCAHVEQICTVKTSIMSQMIPKKFSIILQSQFNNHTLPITHFKS